MGSSALLLESLEGLSSSSQVREVGATRGAPMPCASLGTFPHKVLACKVISEHPRKSAAQW